MFTKISGWGRTLHSSSSLKSFSLNNQSLSLNDSRGLTPRGQGSSYGDSAINSGGVVLNGENLNSIKIDVGKGIAIVGAGVTILELENESMVHGFFPAVVPGTANVSIGGAIASDIHGKSQHRVGSFSDHLLEIKLLGSDGIIKNLRPNDFTSKVFWATVGGMGLTGMIVEATISLVKIESALVRVTEKRVNCLEELLETILVFNTRSMYTVAWIDLSGKFKGRGIVSGANHISGKNSSDCDPLEKLKPLNQHKLKVAYPIKFSLINRTSIRIFNWIWFYKPLGKKVQHIQSYMHPLDGLKNWNIVYGDGGVVQYQFLVPYERAEVLIDVLFELKKSKSGSFLTVVKSFSQDSKGLMGFPMKGWTMAIDFPKNTKDLSRTLRVLDQIVLCAGGRIYLTKDSRMNHQHLPKMYPHLQAWKSIKADIDPNNHWRSDQGRRLKLC